MFKEKLRQVQEYESQAAILIHKANEDCAKIVAEAKKAAVEAGRRAESEAADKTRAVSDAVDAGIAAEIAAIDKTYLQMITELKSAAAEKTEKAAADVSRRVIEGVGR